MDIERANVRAHRWAVLESSMPCYHCRRDTRVTALLVADAQERVELDDPWAPVDGPALLRYIEDLDPSALAAWQAHSSRVRRESTRTSGLTYFLNACEHCDAIQGDWYLMEPDAAFFPTRPEDVATISLAWQDGPFVAAASASPATWIDQLLDLKALPVS